MLRFSLFVIGMMAASTSMAGGVSQCSVDTVPIQIVGGGRSGPVTTLSAAKRSGSYHYPPRPNSPLSFDDLPSYEPRFYTFGTAITKYVATRLGKENLCLDSTESRERSLLQFMHWHITRREDKPLQIPRLDARPSNGCRIFSPWIDIAIERKPVPWIRGIVRWNERQFLADQAILAGAKNVPPGVAMPLAIREYIRFTYDEYVDSEITLIKPAAKPIEERVPPDLLWLFRRSEQSTLALFGVYVGRAQNNAMEKSAEGYTKLVIALIDRCLASDGAVIRYNSILDVADLISLEQYKIDTPIR
jgi:hypothetical protein